MLVCSALSDREAQNNPYQQIFCVRFYIVFSRVLLLFVLRTLTKALLEILIGQNLLNIADSAELR